MYTNRFLTGFVIVFLLTPLDGCCPGPPPPSVQINEANHRTYTTTEVIREHNACGESDGGYAEYEKTFTVDVSGEAVGTVGVDVLKASVTGKYAEGTRTTIRDRFPWPAGKNTRLTVTWTLEEWKGDLVANGKPGTFTFVRPTKVTFDHTDLGCPVIDIKGLWLTPFKETTWNVVFQEGAKFTWAITGDGVGQGTIDGKDVILDMPQGKVTYTVAQSGANGNPVIMTTSDPNLWMFILFRTCDGFKNFMTDFIAAWPKHEQEVLTGMVKDIPNPTCPNILP